MKIIPYDDNDSWLEGRKCRITGTRLSDMRPSKKGGDRKIGFFELIAERLTSSEGEEIIEDDMVRGHRLEPLNLAEFEAVTGKKVDGSLTIWAREDDERIAVSPDAFVVPQEGGKITEAIECKSLSSARHIEALLSDGIPDKFQDQVMQYFICNDDLRAVHLCFYDPRLRCNRFFYRTVTRQDVLADLEATLIMERETLKAIDDIVAGLETVNI